MYRRIVGYLTGTGTMTDSSEERNLQITDTNMEGGGESLDSANRIMVVELRDRIKELEQDLKVRTEECETYKRNLRSLEKELTELKTTQNEACENYKKNLQNLEQQLTNIKTTQTEESDIYEKKIDLLEKGLTDMKIIHTEECENYKNKLQILEKELTDMKTVQNEECENYKRKCERQEKELTALKTTQSKESENYHKKVELLEKELTDLKTTSSSVAPSLNKVSTGVGDEAVLNKNDEGKLSEAANLGKLSDENSELREALTKAGELLKDKTEKCASQEKRNLALTNQVASLKEVVTITKDLLNIRNMEVQHLQSDVESMEGKITEERARHNTMIEKMDETVKLNSDLKNEYETQLRIFKDLKDKYEEKVNLLTRENEKLEKEVSQSKTEPPSSNQLLTDENPLMEETNTE